MGATTAGRPPTSCRGSASGTVAIHTADAVFAFSSTKKATPLSKLLDRTNCVPVHRHHHPCRTRHAQVALCAEELLHWRGAPFSASRFPSIRARATHARYLSP